MAEESLRIANDAVAHALQAVGKAQSEVDESNAKIDNEENLHGPCMTFYIERLKEANERLKEANEYLLRLTQPLQPTKKQRIKAIDRPLLSECIAHAQELSLEESEKLVAMPKKIFSTNFRHGFFIRQEYVDVANIIEKKLISDESIDIVLVVGSPGIGKSVFVLFLLALKEHKDVAYHPINVEFSYYFTWNKTEYDISDFAHAGRRYEGYFDGNGSGDALDFMLFHCVYLFSSPRSANYYEFVKECCFKVYLNPWSKQECKVFAEMINFEDEDEWLQKFKSCSRQAKVCLSICKMLYIFVCNCISFDV
jgi:hypothetical protein